MLFEWHQHNLYIVYNLHVEMKRGRESVSLRAAAATSSPVNLSRAGGRVLPPTAKRTLTAERWLCPAVTNYCHHQLSSHLPPLPPLPFPTSPSLPLRLISFLLFFLLRDTSLFSLFLTSYLFSFSSSFSSFPLPTPPPSYSSLTPLPPLPSFIRWNKSSTHVLSRNRWRAREREIIFSFQCKTFDNHSWIINSNLLIS